MEQHLFTGGAFMNKPVGLNKVDILFAAGQHPEDEVRVEVAGFKETDALATAHISEEEKLHTVFFQSGLMVVTPGFQVGNKLVLAFIECHRQDGDFSAPSDMEQRLEEVIAEIAGIQIAHL